MLSTKHDLKDKITQTFEKIKEYKELKTIEKDLQDQEESSKKMHYRKVKRPRRLVGKRWNRFENAKKAGKFHYDTIYVDMPIPYHIGVYVKNIIPYCIPAICINLLILFINGIASAVLDRSYTLTAAEIKALLFFYAIGIAFGIRKTSDHMAYYHVDLSAAKFNINRIAWTWIKSGRNTNNAEFKVLEHQRQKYNKYILFPSVKELAVISQLDDPTMRPKMKKKDVMDIRDRVNIFEREQEHEAAKAIADWKQMQSKSSENEYDRMVVRYSHRTVKSIKDVIKETQTDTEFNL